MAAVVLSDEPTLAIWELPGLLVVRMRRAPNDAEFAKCRECIKTIAARHQHFSVLIHIPIFDGPIRASRQAQADFVRSLNALEGQLTGTSIAITVQGMMGTMLRLAVNGVLLLGKLHAPIQLHPTLRASAQWLQALPSQTVDLRGNMHLADEIERLK